MELLKPEDFYEPLNGKFFGIMSEMYTQNKPVDINTAIIELKEHNLYEPIGDGSFIVQIIQRITTTAHIYHHAEIVRNYAFCRRMITAGQNISRIAQKPGIEPSEIVSEAEAEILKASQNTESSSPVVLADIDELRSGGSISGAVNVENVRGRIRE